MVTENFDFSIYAGAEMGDRMIKNIKDAGCMHICEQQLLQPSLVDIAKLENHELKTFQTSNSDTQSIPMTTIAEFELDTPSSSEVDCPQTPFNTLKMGENHQHNLGVEDLGSTSSFPNLSSKRKQYQNLRMEDFSPFQQYLNGMSVDKDPPFVPPITPLKQQDVETPSPALNEEIVQQINPDEEIADIINSGEREYAQLSEAMMCALKETAKETAIDTLLPLVEELLKLLYTWLKKEKFDL